MLYILDMTNSKRTRTNHIEYIGVFEVTRKDILAIEDIIKKHLKVFDKVRFNSYVTSTGKRAKKDIVESSFSDPHIEFNPSIFGGRGFSIGWGEMEIRKGADYPYSVDSISHVPFGVYLPYLKISGQPAIYVEFTPMRTRITAQRGYAKGVELESMDQAVERIKKRLSTKRKKGIQLNKIIL